MPQIEKERRKDNLIRPLYYSLLIQVISLEGWTDIMYYVQDAHSFWDWVYFVLLIVVSQSLVLLFSSFPLRLVVPYFLVVI